jgi:hypothetical protein
MPSETKIWNGKYFEVFTPTDPTASYKKMVVLGYVHLSEHELLSLIAEEFKGRTTSDVQVEVLPHRGMVLKG